MIRRNRNTGATLLEVLIAIVVMALGLLGLAGLQSRLQVSEIESYQRSQAVILLQDMANRLASNRPDADDYVTAASSAVGVGTTCPSDLSTQVQRDIREWCLALQGAAEVSGGVNVGAMVGARGCIEDFPTGSGYLITVTWQGMQPLSAPPDGVSCASGVYDGATGSPCTDDRCRRYVTTIVDFGALSDD